MNDELYYDPISVEVNRHPYPVYKRLRDEQPLYHNEKYDFWALSRYDDVSKARFDWKTFNSGDGVLFERMLDPSLPRLPMLEKDPPFHRQERKLVMRSFANSSINALETHVENICAEFLDPYIDVEGFDFVEVLARKIPMMVICALIGIDRTDQEELRPLFEARETALAKPKDEPDISEAVASERKIFDFLVNLVRDRKRHPREDMLTTIAQGHYDEPDGGTARPFTEEESGELVMMLFNGGNSTTTATMAAAASLLGRHPEQLSLLRENRGLMDAALEEILRYEPISPTAGRHNTSDVSYYGVNVPAGSRFILLTGAAARDERENVDPDRFDITRKVNRHLSFGWGIHACIGAALARLEIKTALNSMLDRFPNWTIDDTAVQMRISSNIRGYTALPIEFVR